MNQPSSPRTVVIIGASAKPDRYAYLAMRMLEEHGYPVVLVSPRIDTVEGRPVYPTLSDVPRPHHPIDTVTLYVGPSISSGLSETLLSARPRRVIFNPGAENPTLAATLAGAGITPVDGCTLVMLRTGQFSYPAR